MENQPISMHQSNFTVSDSVKKVNEDLYNSPGLLEVIDPSLYHMLDYDTQNKLIHIAMTQLRPVGIDKELWNDLKIETRSKILKCLYENERDGNIRNDNGVIFKIERPEEVSPIVWKGLGLHARKNIITKVYSLRPNGMHGELWDHFSERDRFGINLDQKISSDNTKLKSRWIPSFLLKEIKPKKNETKRSYLAWWFQRLTIHSRVISFFAFNDHCIIEEPNAAIGGLSLVCALIVTIPFSLFQIVNNDFFTGVSNQFELCTEGKNERGTTYASVHHQTMLTLAGSMYASMMGLIYMAIYYLFKPLPGTDTNKWLRSQGRVLLVLMFFCTVIAIVCLLTCAYYLLNFSAGEYKSLCTYSVTFLYYPGLTGTMVALVASLVAMW